MFLYLNHSVAVYPISVKVTLGRIYSVERTSKRIPGTYSLQIVVVNNIEEFFVVKVLDIINSSVNDNRWHPFVEKDVVIDFVFILIHYTFHALLESSDVILF